VVRRSLRPRCAPGCVLALFQPTSATASEHLAPIPPVWR
jgi:hypothetical protein